MVDYFREIGIVLLYLAVFPFVWLTIFVLAVFPFIRQSAAYELRIDNQR